MGAVRPPRLSSLANSRTGSRCATARSLALWSGPHHQLFGGHGACWSYGGGRLVSRDHRHCATGHPACSGAPSHDHDGLMARAQAEPLLVADGVRRVYLAGEFSVVALDQSMAAHLIAADRLAAQ